MIYITHKILEYILLGVILFSLVGLNFACLHPNKLMFEGRKSGFEMIYVQGGEFSMGGNDEIDDGGPLERRMADECPHLVNLYSFNIGKYEVTRSDWFLIMGRYPEMSSGCDDCPVNYVSWEDIQGFIHKLNSMYAENYRLPTEEEWEFASKGGVEGAGFMYSGSNEVEEVAWLKDNAEQKPHEVGLLKPNELGIYDMSGNIWEWCANTKRLYPCDTLNKELVVEAKALRGGSFLSKSHSVRVNDRNGRNSSMRLETLGFRLVK